MMLASSLLLPAPPAPPGLHDSHKAAAASTALQPQPRRMTPHLNATPQPKRQSMQSRREIRRVSTGRAPDLQFQFGCRVSRRGGWPRVRWIIAENELGLA